jgi:hypothetical protein
MSSGPKADLEPTGRQDGSHPVACAVVSGIAVGLLLLLVGLLSDALLARPDFNMLQNFRSAALRFRVRFDRSPIHRVQSIAPDLKPAFL